MTLIIVIAIIMILALVEWHTGILELLILAKYRGPRENNMVGLSFDDGPDWGEERLIAALNNTGIRATFFWISEKVGNLYSENPQRFIKLIELLKEGQHEVGIHALSCNVTSNPLRRIMGLARSTDITEAQEELSYLLGHKPSLYRPHCFQLGRGLCDGIESSGVTLVLGPVLHIVGNKKKNLGSEYLKNFEKLRSGDIIWGHDSKDCYPDFGIAGDIAGVISNLRKTLADKKLEGRTLSEVINPLPSPTTAL